MPEPTRSSIREVPELKVEVPFKKADTAPVRAREISKETLSQDVRAELVKTIVELRKQMDQGLDQEEVEKTLKSIKEKEQELASINSYIEPIREIKEETDALHAKRQKREGSFFGRIVETFSPVTLPTIEHDGEQKTLPQLYSSLTHEMGLLFLNIRLTPFPGDSEVDSIVFPAMRDAAIQLTVNQKLKDLKIQLSQEGVIDLFRAADASPEVSRSEQEMKVLHDRQDKLIQGFIKAITEVEQLMNVKIGKDKYGNMNVMRGRRR
jgi:hypothetical protein